MKKNTWTDLEIKFLIENFSIKGIKFCSDNLKYDKSKISRMSHKLSLKINKDVKEKYQGKPNKSCNVNPEFFYDINLKEVSYFLGLLWADGFLNKTKNSYNVGITMSKDDVLSNKNTLEKIGKWNYYEIGKKDPKWKDQIRFVTNNKRIYDFLIENDYDKKSYISANKIISKISEKLLPYFFRGLIDGDGCFYYKKFTHSTIRQFAIVSTYNQDWEYFVTLCKELGITYTIKKILRTKSSYSVLRITNKYGIEKIGQYIYSNYENDGIGLERKYIKFQSIINSPFAHTKFKKYNQ